MTAFSECQEDFVRLFHPDTCIVAAIDLHSVKQYEYFGGIIGVHREITVGEGSGDYIVSRVSDHHVSVIGICAVSGDFGSFTGQCDHGCIRGVPVSVQIIRSKEFGIGVLLRVFIYDFCDSQRFSFYKQCCKDKTAYDDGNADIIQFVVR